MKVLVAMSGGVDSAVAALLMVRAGYEVTGITMRLRDKPELKGSCLKCSSCTGNMDACGKNIREPESSEKMEDEWYREERDASKICERLGIGHVVADFSTDFFEAVVAPFISVYEQGGTPNPCVECNKRIKFGRLLDFAVENGYDKLVTGHYAKIEEVISVDPVKGVCSSFVLRKAADAHKDQSYFLYGLTQQQLSHVLFPLGELHKDEVRRLAEENGFVNADKRDSQDICFVPDGDYVRVIEEVTGKTYRCGAFVGPDGGILGEHKGIIRYTVGQRKGLGLSLPEPLYVVKKDVETNCVFLGKNEALFSKTLEASEVNIVPRLVEKQTAIRVMAKTRYSHTACPAMAYISWEENGSGNIYATGMSIEFDELQRAITPGQSVVIYLDDMVVGGGIIIS